MRLSTAIVLLSSTVVALSSPSDASAEEVPPEDERDGVETHFTPELEALVLKVVVSDEIASHAMPAAKSHDERLLIPFGEFCEAVRFPIAVDASTRTARGWFLSPDRTFALDLGKREAWVDDERFALPDDSIVLEGKDIFVDTALLSAWFPLVFELDYAEMTLVIEPAEPLAFEQALEREKRRNNHRVTKPIRGAAHEVHQEPYALVSAPVHDVQLQGTYPTMHQSAAAQRAVPQQNAYEVRGAGDVLFMNGFWRVTGSESDPLRRADLRLQRADPGGGLLGPLQATRVAVGDINAPAVPLTTRGAGGVGLIVSNFPLDRPTDFAQTRLTGLLEPGWEVELYHNERFVGFVRAAGDGDFALTAPVNFGMNEYRLDYWGPYGEHRVAYDRAYVGSEMVRAGEFHYRAHSGLHERSLVPVSDWGDTVPGFGQPRASAEAEYGLIDSLSLFVDTATMPLRDGRHAYAGGGIAGYTENVYGTLRLDGDVTGGGAAEGTVQSRVLGIDLAGRHVQFMGEFASEEFPLRGDPLTSRSEARVGGAIPLWAKKRLPASLTVRHDRHQTGPPQSALVGRLSGSAWSFGWGNNLTARATGTEFTDLAGRASLRWRNRVFSPRLELGYRVAPRPLPTSYGGAMGIRLTRDLGANLRVRREVNAADSWTVSTGVRHRFRYFEWELDGGYTNLAGFAAGVSLRASFGPSPDGGGVVVSSDRRTDRGEVVAQVFRDVDLDGELSEADEPLGDAELQLNGLRRKGLRTNDSGRATLRDGKADSYTNLSLDPGSLADPFDVPATNGITVVPRPGRRTTVALPVVLTGQVEGEVVDGRGSPVDGVDVELVDPSDDVVATTTTVFDGFFVFDYVRPGRYELRVSGNESIASASPGARRTVDVGGEGDVIAGQTLRIDGRVGDRDENRGAGDGGENYLELTDADGVKTSAGRGGLTSSAAN